MTDDRRALVEHTIADLEAQGRPWSTHQVHGLVGGNYPDLVRYLQERRAGTSASPAQSAPDVAAVAVLEPPAPVADPERAERLARHLAKLRASLAAPHAPPAPRPSVLESPRSIHAKGPDPIILGSTTPDTRPRLVRALAEVQRYQTLVERASSQARPLEAQIARFRARQTQLTTDRATVQTVEALRAIKAELVEIEEELEILTRDHGPLAQVVKSVSDSLAQASRAYGQVRAQAIEALDRARSQHFYGRNEADKAKLFRQLTALVGEGDLKTYVTDLTEEAQCRYRKNNPPWKPGHGLL